LRVLKSVLRGLYAAVDDQVVDADRGGVRTPPGSDLLGGLSLGAPEAKAPLGSEFLAPVERVVHALRGADCEVTVLAQPVPLQHSTLTRNDLLAEMRAVQMAIARETVAGPLAEQYLEILKQGLSGIVEGVATGLWRTAVYLTGTEDGYPSLASTWRSVYASGQALFEPMAVLDWPGVSALAERWAMPDVGGSPSPSLYQRPFHYQSLLNSRQLAAYVHLPDQEVPGFAVTLLPAFDTVRRSPLWAGGNARPRPALVVGDILHHGTSTKSPYLIELDDLSRHCLVCGVTGAGKTTTVLSLVLQAVQAGVPYLVVEPVKTEYRALSQHVVAPARVYTAGNAAVSPLMINPFEVPAGIPLAVHIDLIRALFTAAFDMWTPMPQILERSIHEIYTDRGWSVLDGTNTRLDDGMVTADAWPTLTDLADKVEEVIGQLGYSGEIVSNLRTGLSARIEGLRIGGKGAMLDVALGISAEDLFDRPVVLELEALGAAEDRAFVMGLIVLRLAEHRRHQGASRSLRHLLVLEEAHRLLSRRQPGTATGQDDASAKAVDAFVDLLAEIRAYGQGVIIADQVPARLAPEALKNTNLKIMQRTVAEDDRTQLAAATAMTADQSVMLATLSRGTAAVFSEGDDSPLLVRVDPGPPLPRPADAELAGLARPAQNPDAAPGDDRSAGTRLGRSTLWRAAVSRLVLSVDTDAQNPGLLAQDLKLLLKPHLTGNADANVAVVAEAVREGARWLARRRAAQHGWSYSRSREWRSCITAALTSLLRDQPNPADVEDRVTDLARLTSELHARTSDPYPACAAICANQPPTCLYRHPNNDLLADARPEATALTDSSNPGTARRAAAALAAHVVTDFPGGLDTRRGWRAASCLLQIAAFTDPATTPTEARDRFARVLTARKDRDD
jgi:DNA helicase HerA-like ATPase